MKKKVAFCIPNMVIGGVENVFINIMEILLKETDFEFVIVMHDKLQEKFYSDWFASHPELKLYIYRPLGNWFQELVAYCTRFPLKQFRKILFSLYKKYRRVFVWATRRLADVDVFIDYKNLEFFKELKYFNRTKIAWSHSAFKYFEDNNLISRLGQYDKLVVLTNGFVKDFEQKYPEQVHKICQIYNPIIISDIIEKSKSVESPSGRYFCCVSRLVYGKDIKTLLRAFDIFAKNEKNVKLYIVGDGECAEEYKKYASRLDCFNNVIFTGSINNPFGYIKGAVAHILSSEHEGLPTVMLESMVCGVLNIASDCPNGPREIAMDGKAGILFEVGNAEQLAQIMSDICNNRIDTKKMIDTASKSLSRFDPDCVSSKVLSLINRN